MSGDAAGTGSPSSNVDSTSAAGTDTNNTNSPPPDVGSAPIDDPADVILRGECASTSRLGGFLVDSGESFAAVSGDAADVINPVATLEEVMVDGSCRLLRPIQPFCDPPCSGGELCNLDETCITAPTSQDLGTVSVLGLVQGVVMEPAVPGNNYFDTTLPVPGFDANAVVQLVSTDGYYGELSLYGVGSEQLAGIEELEIPETGGLDVVWDPPAGTSYATVRFILSIDQHGVTPAQAVCDFEDTGTGSVSAEMIDALRGAGISGFPNSSLSRHTLDAMDVDGGCVDLDVASRRKVTITVDGHVPCMLDPQCPDGEVCNMMTQTCVPR